MTTQQFQRARSEAQRQQRRDAILSVAADMVLEMPVADLSLNELSRRVGLAKSNVLRYFESREAVLLELLDAAWQEWLGRLASDLDGADQSERSERSGASERSEASERTPDDVAEIITISLVNDRLFCELMSVSAAILERNISVEVARRYKQSSLANIAAFAGLVERSLPGLSPAGATYFAAGTIVAITGIWPVAHPSEAMLCVYEDPAMASLRLDLATALREMLATLLTGCLIRPEIRYDRSLNGTHPFNDSTDRDQFTTGVDVTLTF